MAIRQDIEITYGTYVVGGKSGNIFKDQYQTDEGPNQITLEYSFLIHGEDQKEFDDKVLEATKAFRTPEKDTLIKHREFTVHSWSHLSATGMNARPKIIKTENPANSSWTRVYTVRIEMDAPADERNLAGRREATILVKYLPSRRRVITISGVYTAIAGTGARATYEAGITAFENSVMSDLGVTRFDQVDESAEADDTDRILVFSRIYKEEFHGEKSGAVADPEIVDQVLVVTTDKVAPGDSIFGPGGQQNIQAGGAGAGGAGGGTVALPAGGGQPGDNPGREDVGVERPVTVSLRYTAWIDKDLTVDLVAKYEGDIRPWLLTNMFDTFGNGDGALTREFPQYDFPDNRISVDLVLIVPVTPILEFAYTRINGSDPGTKLAPVQDDEPDTYVAYQAKASLTRTHTIVQRRLGGAGGGGGGGAGKPFGANAAGGGFGAFGIQGRNFRPGVQIRGLNQNRLKGIRPPRLANAAVTALGAQAAGNIGANAVNAAAAGGGGGGGGGGAPAAAGPAQWMQKPDTERTVTSTERLLGIAPHQITVEDRTETWTEIRVRII